MMMMLIRIFFGEWAKCNKLFAICNVFSAEAHHHFYRYAFVSFVGLILLFLFLIHSTRSFLVSFVRAVFITISQMCLIFINLNSISFVAALATYALPRIWHFCVYMGTMCVCVYIISGKSFITKNKRKTYAEYWYGGMMCVCAKWNDKRPMLSTKCWIVFR